MPSEISTLKFISLNIEIAEIFAVYLKELAMWLQGVDES